MEHKKKDKKWILFLIFGILIVGIFIFALLNYQKYVSKEVLIKKENVGEITSYSKINPYVEGLSYTQTTKTDCTDGKCTKTLHGGTKYVFEDSVWKNVSDANSLLGTGVIINVLEEDKNFKVNVLDYNYTHIQVELETAIEDDIPVVVWGKNITKLRNYSLEKIELNESLGDLKDYYKNVSDKKIDILETFSALSSKKTKTYEFGFGKILEFGYNSTTIVLNDTSENMADIYYADGSLHVGSQVRWNITAVPNNQDIEDSTFCGAIVSKIGSQDLDNRIWRVDDQSWTETISDEDFKAQSLTNQTDGNFNSVSDATWSCSNVTNMVKFDYLSWNDYSSFRINDLDAIVTISSSSVTDENLLYIGDTSGYIAYDDRESNGGGYLPNLSITYEDILLSTFQDDGEWVRAGSCKGHPWDDCTNCSDGWVERDEYEQEGTYSVTAYEFDSHCNALNHTLNLTGCDIVNLSMYYAGYGIEGGEYGKFNYYNGSDWFLVHEVNDTNDQGDSSPEPEDYTYFSIDLASYGVAEDSQIAVSYLLSAVSDIVWFDLLNVSCEAEPADSCTYSSGDWNVDCSDYCNITSNVNVGSNDIILSGTGYFQILANITADSIAWDDDCEIYNDANDGNWIIIEGS